MIDEPSRIEQAVKRARYELAEQAGEPLTLAVETVFFNALSDIIVRGESVGAAQEASLACLLALCRRVCGLLSTRRINEQRLNAFTAFCNIPSGAGVWWAAGIRKDGFHKFL